MKKGIICFIICFVCDNVFSQSSGNQNFNLSFEQNSEKNSLPKDWFEGGNDYKIIIDTLVKFDGKKSVAIFNSKTTDSYSFGTVLLEIPANYKGKQIELKGYMKTQDIKNGFAGLVLRIDGNTDVLQFDNMYRQKINGTSDWKPYSVKLPFPKDAKSIVVGAILTGNGKMWVDNLSINIDNIDVSLAEKTTLSKAATDNEFDEGSNISLTNLSKKKIEDIKLLGMVWGFLKYYHPNAGSGDYNMDYELFRIMNKILDSDNSLVRDNLLEEWISTFGEFEYGHQNTLKEEIVKLKPDLKWIDKEKMSDGLRTKLYKIKDAKRSGKNYYVSLNVGVGNPEFNEESYQQIKYSDTGFQLLSLFRYWNIIKYFFPYKYLIEEDWDNIITEFIPKYIKVSNEKDYRLAVLELVSRIKDTHAGIRGSEGALREFYGKNYLCTKIGFVEGQAVVTGYYDEAFGLKSDLKIGDVIVSINNESIDEIIKEKQKYTSASNDAAQLRIISSYLMRTNDPFMKIKLKRGKENHSFTVPSYSTDTLNIYKRKKEPYFKAIEPKIAYINAGYLKNEHINEIKQKVADTEGLIIDLRIYPSDFIIFSLGEILMPSPKDFVKFSSVSIENPGLFTYNSPLSLGKDNADSYKGKVVILVNEETQSLGEYCAMAFRIAPNAKVIGSTTAGADGNVSKIMLPGRVLTAMSGIGVYYPDGTETQRIGIVPDVVIKPTIAGIAKNRDELLEEAIKMIQNNN